MFPLDIPTCPLTYLRIFNLSVELRIGYIKEELRNQLTFDLECFNCTVNTLPTFTRRFEVIKPNIKIAAIHRIDKLKPFTTYWMRVTPIAKLKNVEQRKLPCNTILFTTKDGGKRIAQILNALQVAKATISPVENDRFCPFKVI